MPIEIVSIGDNFPTDYTVKDSVISTVRRADLRLYFMEETLEKKGLKKHPFYLQNLSWAEVHDLVAWFGIKKYLVQFGINSKCGKQI